MGKETKDIIPFNFENHEIRVLLDDDGNPWWVAKDVAEALAIEWKGNVTLDAIPENWKGVRKYRTPGGEQELITINEPALYKFSFRSRKAEADRFTNWVAEDVLPSIRKTGAYLVPGAEQALAPLKDRTLYKMMGLCEQLAQSLVSLTVRVGTIELMMKNVEKVLAPDGNVIKEYFHKCLRPAANGAIDKGRLYRSYLFYCERIECAALSRNAFFKAFKADFPAHTTVRRKNEDGDIVPSLKGLVFTTYGRVGGGQ